VHAKVYYGIYFKDIFEGGRMLDIDGVGVDPCYGNFPDPHEPFLKVAHKGRLLQGRIWVMVSLFGLSLSWGFISVFYFSGNFFEPASIFFYVEMMT